MSKLEYSPQESNIISEIVNNSEAILIIGAKLREDNDTLDGAVYLKGEDSIIIASLTTYMNRDKRVFKIISAALESHKILNN